MNEQHQAKLESINNYLQQISSEVNLINDKNLEIKLKNVNSYIKQIGLCKKSLKDSTSKAEYSYVCDVVHRGVKQISAKIDSIIESKKEEQNKISSELSKVVNKKKLINYQR